MRTRARPGIDLGEIERLDPAKVPTGYAGVNWRAAKVQEAHAECLRQPGARIVGGGAADAEDNLLDAAGDGVGDELAGAVGRRDQRVALVLRHEREARRFRHLDDRGAAVAEEPIGGLHAVAERRRHLRLHDRSAGRVDQRLNRPLPAVGHRHFHVYGVGPNALETGLELARDLQRRQVLFEGIGGNDNFHRALLLERWARVTKELVCTKFEEKAALCRGAALLPRGTVASRMQPLADAG